MDARAFDNPALRTQVERALGHFFARQLPVMTQISPDLGPVSEALAAFVLDGGKRLRPTFCYWGWRGAGRDHDDPDSGGVIGAAAALELLQACALIHDDLMDNSDTRRGSPSMHRAFSAMHAKLDWQGQADQFGEAAAILLGDLALVWANQLLDQADLDATTLRRARPVYDQMCFEVMAGQYLDIVEQVSGASTVDRALRVARYKAAKYTVERPLHLGAAFAGASPEVVASYTEYGLPLGETFQLRDDVLGVFGDPEVTGKPAGDDLREGKRTVLVAAAMERVSPAEQRILQSSLGSPTLDGHGVDELRSIITSSGALDFVEGLIADRLAAGSQALAAAPITGEAREALTGLAEAATARTL